MYIRSAFLQNIKCFKQVKINFQSNRQRHNDSLSNWNVILGNNGDGKTTLLQAIASCLMDKTTAQRLLQVENFGRNGEEQCKFSIEITPDKHDKLSSSTIVLYKEKWNIERQILIGEFSLEELQLKYSPIPRLTELYLEDRNKIPKLMQSINFLNRNVFIRENNNGWVSCGYGAVHSTSCYYTPTDIDDPLQRRFLTLFKENGSLYHGEDWLKELDRKALRHGAESLQSRNLAEAKQAIEALLPETIIKIDDEIRFIQHGHEVKLNQLSDGYRSIFAMSVDLLRWLELMRPDPNIPINEVSGVVLIDEVDAHLHPTWQRQVGFWLTKTFPNIQFIVTTHSPFVAMAAGKGALTVLEKKGDAVEANQNVPYIRGWTVDKVLSELFELTSLRDPETEGKLKRYQTLRFALQANQLSPEEATELKMLESDLDKQLGSNYALPDEQDLNQTLDFLAQALKQKRTAHA